jgi:hypothetical protein
MSDAGARIRLVFVDRGAYHVVEVTVPRTSLDGHERLIDCVREDPAVLKQLHVDVERLCAAYVVEAD